ncbi:MAG: RHS repeat-associated core domain-containing protein [Spirochaetaceae bacterium]|nr:RHS repeat-associated core domain-containing protein [Spirochaetaceae bacterium]
MGKSVLQSAYSANVSAQKYRDGTGSINQPITAGRNERGSEIGTRYRYIDETPLVPLTEAGKADNTNAASSASGAKARSRPNNEYVLYSYGEPVAKSADGNASYFGTDIFGSVRNVTDKYGTVQADYSYDAFGSPYLGNLENDIGFGYCGKVYDIGTGLYDYGFRDYSPNNARFTTIDPIKDGSNWFSYVVNDPVNYVDPLGLKTTDSNISNTSSNVETNVINPGTDNSSVSDNNTSTNNTIQESVQNSTSYQQLIQEIMHNNSSNNFNPNNLHSTNHDAQIKHVQQVIEEQNQIYNNNMNQQFVEILRDCVGATYSGTRMPTSSNMDCSGMLVYALDKMGFEVPANLTADDIVNGKLSGIIIYDDVDNSRQGNAGVLNFYYFDEKYISHVNYGVGKQGDETIEQVVDASSFGTTWQNGKDGKSGRNANNNQNPKAEPGTINKTWAPFSTKNTPDYQGYIDFTKLKRKD